MGDGTKRHHEIWQYAEQTRVHRNPDMVILGLTKGKGKKIQQLMEQLFVSNALHRPQFLWVTTRRTEDRLNEVFKFLDY
jgi:hypothetical protein